MLEYDRIDISEGTDIKKKKKKKMHQKSVKFFIIDTLQILVLNMNHIFVIVVMA